MNVTAQIALADPRPGLTTAEKLEDLKIATRAYMRERTKHSAPHQMPKTRERAAELAIIAHAKIITGDGTLDELIRYARRLNL
ncbi:MAG: hypothetical protein ACFB11_00650 [Paracoccaceae bacterium]